MSQQRSSDIVEQYGMKAISAGIGGILLVLIGIILWIYRGGGVTAPLAIVILLIGAALIGYAIYEAMQIRKVASFVAECSYCKHKNRLSEPVSQDFLCSACYRMVPVQDGRILTVSQVRCGFCNELNYYSERNQVLLCESCNHEIPLSRGDDAPQRHSVFAVKEDSSLYELVLTGHDGHHTENLIACLQSMLALNRNHVKQMFEEMPVTILSGIPRMKAEMLQAQIATHGGYAEFRQVGS